MHVIFRRDALQLVLIFTRNAIANRHQNHRTLRPVTKSCRTIDVCTVDEAVFQGPGKAGRGEGSADPLKFGGEVKNVHMAFTSDRCQSNVNDHLYNFNTLETTCLHSHIA